MSYVSNLGTIFKRQTVRISEASVASLKELYFVVILPDSLVSCIHKQTVPYCVCARGWEEEHILQKTESITVGAT